MVNAIAVISLVLFVLVIPLGLCFAVERHREWFAGARLQLWVIGLTLFSWLYTNAPPRRFFKGKPMKAVNPEDKAPT